VFKKQTKNNQGAKRKFYAARQFFSVAFPKRSFRRFSSGTSGAAEQPLP
jgi:hypothetical protein